MIKSTRDISSELNSIEAELEQNDNICLKNCCSLELCLSQFQLGTSPPGNPGGLAQKHCPGGRDLTFESCPGAGNSTRARILWKFKVKRFVRVLVLSVINTGCPKSC